MTSANSFLSRILKTDGDVSATIARVALGVMILPHGLQKTLGWFGGYGFSGTMQFFTETMGIPWILALAAILAESVGGLMLILGLGARVASALVGITLFVAALTSHVQHGFFMNWFGQQKGEGIEFFILALGLALIVTLKGAGKFSADRALVRS
ncbi:MAG TPA: DoxX family protein [Oligoflexus sp.]|uniref:DoxX family protein n=1 Tax=Oligoflexus sp. TaxID=1971216 RepID=UPI002D7FF440|nr:DoxX family protein [Oligoflexus sp.]HET9241639.1 DoxX family protein [Oligoflexus sp.]